MNQNARLFLCDNMTAMSAYWVCSGTVVAAMTSYYEIPLGVANILTGVTSTLTLLQMLGGICYARARNKTVFLRVTAFLWRLLVPIAFFTVLLPIELGAALFVAAVPCMVALFQFACPSQTAWMVGAVEGHTKSNYFALREMAFMLTFSAMFCCAGFVIDGAQRANTQRAGFLTLGVLETALILVSLVLLLRLPRAAQDDAPNAASGKGARPPLIQLVRAVLQNHAFMRVLRLNVIWSFACMFIGSFAAVYQIRTLNMPFSMILVWATVGNLARSIATPLMQRLAQRIGWQRVVQCMIGIMMLNAVGWMCITKQNMWALFPVLSVVGALPFAGLGVGFLQLQVDTIGNGDRTLSFSMLATLNGLGALCGSMLCSALIGALETGTLLGLTDLRTVFAVGLAGLVAAQLAAWRVHARQTAK